MLAAQIDNGADGFRGALQWPRAHRPADEGRRSICNGDLWGGNMLVDDHGRISGVLDWSASSIAEPALDVGATALAFCLIPVPYLGPLRPAAERVARALYQRYVRSYQRLTGADLRTRPYYEALRAASELSFVAAWRLSEARGEHHLPRPSWDAISGAVVEFFRVRTAVTIVVPPPVGGTELTDRAHDP